MTLNGGIGPCIVDAVQMLVSTHENSAQLFLSASNALGDINPMQALNLQLE